MKSNLQNALVVLCWIISFNPTIAFGLDLLSEECFSPSPTIQKGENLFAYPKIRRLKEQGDANVQKLLQSLVGQWQGTMDEVVCHGSELSSSKEINHCSVDAKALLSREGDFSIKADLYCHEKKTDTQIVHYISVKERILRWGGDKGFVEPISLSAGQLSFLSKTGAYGVLKEMYITIEGDNNLLVIEEKIYTRGKFSGRRYWLLKG